MFNFEVEHKHCSIVDIAGEVLSSIHKLQLLAGEELHSDDDKVKQSSVSNATVVDLFYICGYMGNTRVLFYFWCKSGTNVGGGCVICLDSELRFYKNQFIADLM